MLALINGNLIDGVDMSVKAGAAVLIDGKRIAAAGYGFSVPEDARVIDLKGRYIIPGLSDAHTHIGGSARTDRPPHTSRFLSYDYAEHRSAAFDWGITALRSAGDFVPDIFEVRAEAESGKLLCPHIIAAGKMLQAKGGHPGYTVLFGDREVLQHEIMQIDEDTDIEAGVRELAEAGVDWIKFHLSEMDIFHYPEKKKRLTNAQILRIVRAAHAAGLPVMAHVDDMEGMKEAVLAGADSVEHTINVGAERGTVMTEELLELLTARNVWVVPTLVATQYHDGKNPEVTPVFNQALEAVGKMIRAGVQIGVGCDSGIPFLPYGKCVHEEMELLCRAGMTPAQALQAATEGNARMFGKEAQFGTVTAQKAADLVILKKNPLDDIRNTRAIEMVIYGGSIVRDNWLSI